MITIGILNLTEHLEETIDGFQSSLEIQGIEPDYIYHNAHGKEQRLISLARKLVKEKPALIFACSTPSALALKQVMTDKIVPVVYAPVFNPHLSGLIDPTNRVLRHFTGVSGMVNPFLKIEMIEKIFPDLKKITLFYDPEDTLSLFDYEKLSHETANKGLVSEGIPLVEGVLESEKLSPIHGPVLLVFSLKIEDNLEKWIGFTHETSLPVVASSKRGAVLGCLAGLYADHYQLGEIAAQKAKKILDGTLASAIEISYPEGCKIVCNYMTATTMNFEFPLEISMKGDIC